MTLHRTPSIDKELRAQLTELDTLRVRLRADTPTTLRWMGSLRRLIRAKVAESSVSIEGYRVSLDQARAILGGQQSAAIDEDAEQAVACYGRAMDHAIAMADDPGFSWSDRAILDLHFDVCYWQMDKRPGRWRMGDIGIADSSGVVYEAPPVDTLPALLEEFVDWLRHGDLEVHAVVRAAMAHLHLISLHPFRDGNGRVSRIVQSLVLAREGLLAPEMASIEEYLGEHTDKYYTALREAQGPAYDPTRSARGWVEFCIRAHREQANRRLREVALAGARWTYLEALVEERRWPDRLVIALEHALTGILTNAGYRSEAEISTNQAALDFRRLVDAELVRQVGSGRASHYIATDRLRGAEVFLISRQWGT